MHMHTRGPVVASADLARIVPGHTGQEKLRPSCTHPCARAMRSFSRAASGSPVRADLTPAAMPIAVAATPQRRLAGQLRIRCLHKRNVSSSVAV